MTVDIDRSDDAEASIVEAAAVKGEYAGSKAH